MLNQFCILCRLSSVQLEKAAGIIPWLCFLRLLFVGFSPLSLENVHFSDFVLSFTDLQSSYRLYGFLKANKTLFSKQRSATNISLPNAKCMPKHLSDSVSQSVRAVFAQTDYRTQITRRRQAHIIYICAHTHRSPDREISQRLFKEREGVLSIVCVCFSGGSNKLHRCWLLCQIHILFNNLYIKYPPLAPPKPITGTHRRMRGGGESQSVRVVWINPSLHTRPLLPLSIFLFEIHSDLKPDVRDKV